MALACVCFGLRISECLGLKWGRCGWSNGKLNVERGIVRQKLDDVRTIYSQRQMSIVSEVLEVLKAARQVAQFSADEIGFSHDQRSLDALQWSYPHIWRTFQNAAATAGAGKLGTHTLRHSYRAWLDAVGTAIAVQQKPTRHTSIHTTMNIYSDVVTDQMVEANSKVQG